MELQVEKHAPLRNIWQHYWPTSGNDSTQMVYYVKVRMQLSLVRTASLLIRGSRNHQGHCWRIPPDGAAMSDWQTWQERD